MKAVVFILCLLPLTALCEEGSCDGADMMDRYEILHLEGSFDIQHSGCSDWMSYSVSDSAECLQEGCVSDADTIAYASGVCYSWICGSSFAVTPNPAGFLLFRKKAVSVRLSGGPNGLSGMVEMYSPSHGAWGLVCDKNFGMDTWPIRVCSQLGFGAALDVSSVPAPTLASDALTSRPAFQSTDFEASSTAQKAVDGNTDTDYAAGSCSRTEVQTNPWWAVDMGSIQTVSSVSITNRGDCCGEQLADFVVLVTNHDPRVSALTANTSKECLTHSGSVDQGATVELHCTTPVSGIYLVILSQGQNRSLTLCEVAVQKSEFIALSEPQCLAFQDGDLLQECGEGPACKADNAVKVTCAYPHNRVRLTGGVTEQEGIVEYLNDNGQWGTVCDPSSNLGLWPDVVCNQLGYGPAIDTSLVPGARTGLIGMQDPGACDPVSVSKLSNCPKGGSTCDHNTDVYIVCGASIRLSGGDTSYNGYAEVYKNGKWGNVCDSRSGFPTNGRDQWAKKFCQWLGFSGAEETHVRGGAGSGNINSNNPTCVNAKNFRECIDQGTCGHEHDAFITCSSPVSQVRLTGGQTANEGRAEYKEGDDGEWGTICNSANTGLGGWADVLCAQLGYGAALTAHYTNKNIQLPITLMQPSCTTADARTMGECAIGNGMCDHLKDVWIACDPKAASLEVIIMLDISGSLSQKETGSMLSQETNFLHQFFAHTTTKDFIFKYSLSLTVIPFKTAVINGEKWVLEYADYKTTGELSNAENTGLNTFVSKIQGAEPEGRTNIGQSMKNVKDAHTINVNTIVIVVSDFLNMDKTPEPLGLVDDFTNADAHVIPVMINSPVRNKKLYDGFLSHSKDRWGMDLSATSPNIGGMFAKIMNEE